MQSATHASFGDAAEVLTATEQPTPEPGPGLVRVKLILASIHNHDVSTVRGEYGYKPALPAVGGSEAVGVIDALGEEVTGCEVGQRVLCAGVRGAWAEYFLTPAKSVVPVPDALSDETAAQLFSMPFSALSLLNTLQLEPGDWIAQNTANGAVGKTLAMLAKRRGVRVLNLVRRESAVEELAALGIEHALSTEHDDWKARALTITEGASIRAGVDSISGQASGELLSILGEDSTLVCFGALSGQPMKLSPGDMIFKRATVKGFWGSKVSAQLEPAAIQAMIGELFALALSGALQLPVEATFPLSQIKDAMRAHAKPARQGKVLLRP